MKILSRRYKNELNIGWDQFVVIPSSKSGSTDETMMIFTEILKVLLNKTAGTMGINGPEFAKIVMDTLHDVNFIDGNERKAADLFKVDEARFGTTSLTQLIASRTNLSPEQVKAIFGKVLGNMIFETTNRPEKSRLAAFMQNSKLESELGKENSPVFIEMFDNVGGRWTADLHMMAFLGLDAAINKDKKLSAAENIGRHAIKG
jgi:hypothetical protein